ncbi:MAG: nucleoside deaminase [Candidatus Omnitrophica bacterium]|nr:nucleoside deaminase [Candidatus Omnitrophota bacterium]
MNTNSDKKFMRLAIREAGKNLKTPDGGPFGACVVKDGRVVGIGRNTVLKNDATCHAEMNAIRAASKRLGTYDLSGSVIYSTTEPCPMCFSAIHWARIDAVIYGTTIGDVKKLGFNELSISGARMKALGKSGVKIIPKCLVGECTKLLKDWDKLEYKLLY